MKVQSIAPVMEPRVTPVLRGESGMSWNVPLFVYRVRLRLRYGATSKADLSRRSSEGAKADGPLRNRGVDGTGSALQEA